ncbi:helix-turn-helix domain-containing protein [Limosilactobacillus fastidiosus]|uniref:Helix-turn-helix transcriptional regulator n=1 Tax=Limosilactobacillus fastidiosus TaxID=2759855 RepID=A0A7W3U0S4_9LACO|nr:helix-turn-helix transcriptional regulator [Limosilactobacillus fastidiosus]MBB1086817.1 helix-turn-helix transcriptional regulator [Limosilactobacillus fastidiosus]MCD7085456.1 helix-turn-helix transcriptional regulator [Limosilactobacillus fastidiosus]MCD7114687.1 helix-turn-helix transcriptional regulator [Limosilactobacillus fastidiosus]MCD7116064.1 helix-turn-helix transcriptional regulator [Limosilactobacillus fastidiosus]
MNRIRKCRQNKKLTLKQLSEELAKQDFKISADALGKYERGEREPKLEIWGKLADFFDVSVPYIQGLEDEDRNDSFKIWEIKNDLKNGNNYLKNNVKDFLKYNTDTSIDKLSQHDIKLIWDVETNLGSLIGSLTDFGSFKTIKALNNAVKTLTVITSEYRIISDNPTVFEKRVIPIINEFLFELKKIE